MSQLISPDLEQCIDGLATNAEDPGQMVATRLRRSGHPFLWGVSCELRQGVLVLDGTVPTFHLKQLAQELALHTPGVTQVRNELHVTGCVPRLAFQFAAG